MPTFRAIMIISAALLMPAVQACTAMAREYRGQFYSGRTFDWPDGRAVAVINARDTKRQALSLMSGVKPLHWRSTYGSVTIDMVRANGQPNRAAVVDGINEKGLSASVLELDDTQYPAVKSTQAVLGSAQLIQYVLDKYERVADVVKALPSLPVVSSLYKGQAVPLHFVFNDAKGNQAVLEYLKGRARIYQQKPGQLQALSNTPYQQAKQDWLQFNQLPVDKRVITGYGSKARFLKAAQFLQYDAIPQTRWAQFSLLLVGLSSAAEPPQAKWPTMWQLVRNNSTQHFCFRAQRNQHIRCFDLSLFDFSRPHPAFIHLS